MNAVVTAFSPEKQAQKTFSAHMASTFEKAKLPELTHGGKGASLLQVLL